MASDRSIALSGFSRADEDSFRSLFDTANRSVGGGFCLGAEAEADVLIIDVDSIYGQMGLMQARSSGKTLVALTSGARADADYLLQRPLDGDAIDKLLRTLSLGSAESRPSAAKPTPPPTAAQPRAANTGLRPAPLSPIQAQPPAPAPARPTPPPPFKPHTPSPVSAAAAPAEAPLPAREPAPIRPRSLFELMQPGLLPGPVQLQREGAPALVLEPNERVYFGGPALKPYLPYVASPLGEDEPRPVAAASLPTHEQALGGRQPMARLLWLAALNAGGGQLIGFDPATRFKLAKWPQIEREFPKHFRIATVMMKAASTVEDIAAASGATREEVCDLLNAYLATGFAEPEQTPASAAVETVRSGLMDRLRGLRG